VPCTLESPVRAALKHFKFLSADGLNIPNAWNGTIKRYAENLSPTRACALASDNDLARPGASHLALLEGLTFACLDSGNSKSSSAASDSRVAERTSHA